MSVAVFLSDLLQNGWQLHLRYGEHRTMLSRTHEELRAIANLSASNLCLAVYEIDSNDLEQRIQQGRLVRECCSAFFREISDNAIILEHLAFDNLTANLTSFPENWFLFDIKGNPICAVPNQELGMAFCEEVKQQHGIVLQCFNAFERFIPKSFKEWERLNRVKDNRLFLRIKIALCKLQKHLFEFLIRSVF
ncbi:MAG: hypothetical protein J6W29_00260 [Neisseriaceae bacterium]|nr:hypothetical protein [Neisseriaceae bacterium]